MGQCPGNALRGLGGEVTMKTVFITGASSGIGLATAELFLRRGWRVIATARNPESVATLQGRAGVVLLPLDVTHEDSISKAVNEALLRVGNVDVVINNAGYGAFGPFEAASSADVRRQFETNVVGLMAVTKAFLPHFRQRRMGTFVNVSSVGGRVTFPLYSIYHASKFAVEGFSESLRHEVRDFGIRIRLVEPGPVKTEFNGRSAQFLKTPGLGDYDSFVGNFVEQASRSRLKASQPEDIAEIIFRAATDSSERLRFVAGKSARLLSSLAHLSTGLRDRPMAWLLGSKISKG